VSGLENHVTNYGLLLADTMEGQAAYLLGVISFGVLHAMYEEPKKKQRDHRETRSNYQLQHQR